MSIVGTEGNICLKICRKWKKDLLRARDALGSSLCKGETTCLACSDTVKDVQDSIATLDVKCPLLRDCDWKGELSEAESHLKDCLSFLIVCKECKQIFPRRDEEEHEDNYCPVRFIDCVHCYKHGKAEDREQHSRFCQ